MNRIKSILFVISTINGLCLGNPIIIRPATLEDLNEISCLITNAYEETFKPCYAQLFTESDLNKNIDINDFISKKITYQINAAQEFITKQSNQEEYGFLIAYTIKSEKAQKLIGCCRFKKNSTNNIHIYLLSINKKFQRHGIGTNLLRHTIKTFNTSTCTLCVLRNNDIAHTFYQKFGFVQKGTRALDHQTGELLTDPMAPITLVEYSFVVTQ